MSKDSIELKPCPFCGERPHYSTGDSAHIVCMNGLCDVMDVMFKQSFNDFDGLVKAWNTRTSPSLEGFDKTVSDAMARYEAMTDEQKAEMWKRQREGYVKAELELSASERETTFIQPITTRPSPSDQDTIDFIEDTIEVFCSSTPEQDWDISRAISFAILEGQKRTRPSPSLEELTGVVEVFLSKNDLAYEISHGDTSENDAAKLIAQAISNYIGEGE